MKPSARSRLFVCLLGALAAGTAQAQYSKLDAALSDIIDRQQGRLSTPSRGAPRSSLTDMAVKDSAERVLVDVYLDGSVPMAAFVAQLQALGAEITGVNPDFNQGAVSAFLPPAAASALAATPGLHVAKLSPAPLRNVGAVNSQGTTILRSTQANTLGFTGAGITVGVLSDSYDRSPTSFTTIRPANDIASGDLKTPKLVLDATPGTGFIDEGRAMMQIVLDVAPGADLCFATAFSGEAGFAANIRALRTNPLCAADVIVDDVIYFAEPIFSDGQIAQAVDDVANSTTLAGKRVAYYSSAGNQGGAGGGGAIDVPNATFSTTPTGIGNINLATAATCSSSPATGSTKADVAGGWLNFGGGTFAVPVNYNSAGSTLTFQWDDPFFRSAVTTDLNFYLFDASGNCTFAFAANNIATDSAAEVVGLSGGASGAFRIMVGRTSAGTRLASRVRMVNLGGWSGAAFSTSSSPTTWGHSAAAGATSVAAYRYTSPATQVSPFIPAFENFSSPGPITIAFDATGARLPVAEVRKKPDLAGPDGGDTTFFFPGSDYEGNGRPNFFGTSAAAPHIAGVAALLLQKAGGPNSLTPKQVKSILQVSTPARVIPFVGGAASKAWSLYDGFGQVDAINALNRLP